MKMRRMISACLSAFMIAAFIGGCKTTPRKTVELKKEENFRGLYIPYTKWNRKELIKGIIEKGRPLGINMLVIDAHPFGKLKARIDQELIDWLKKENIYIAARVVCFQGGLNRLPVKDNYMENLMEVIEASCKAGFNEVQLDYIRFEDGGVPYRLDKKYEFIEELLKGIRAVTNKYGVKLSADVFGRIVYNRKDRIGQNLELFGKYTDVIYPMLYPSHFTADKYRMSNPGFTVKEGTEKGIDRLAGAKLDTRIQPFIQAFPYNVKWARVNLIKYIEMQVTAAEETKARGWVCWNAYCQYGEVLKALQNLKEESLSARKNKETPKKKDS